MELSLAFIACKATSRYRVRLVDPDGNTVKLDEALVSDMPSFKSTRLLTRRHSSPLASDILPIVDGDDTETGALEIDAPGIVWVGDAPAPSGIFALQIFGKPDCAEVFDFVLDLLEQHNAWITRVRDMLLERAAIPDVVMLLGEMTDNPFWFGDAALRVRCMSDDRLLSQYSDKWDYQRKTGHYPVEVISLIVESGDLERMNKPSRAWLFDDAVSYTLPFVTKTIFLNGNVYGYLFIIESNADTSICDLELAEALGNYIATYVKHGNVAVSGTQRFTEQMLRACLAGNDVTDDERGELLDLLGWDKSPGYMVAAFHRGEDASIYSEAPQIQVELLRDNLGIGYVFAYDVYIIAIMDTASHSCAQIEDLIESTCRELGWKAGVSDEFSDFSTLDDHYGQAQIALQKGLKLAPERIRYPYRDFNLAYLCQKLTLELERPLYMHPDVERLIAYDQANDSELAKTLAAYLENERNISRTAKELFLHRNSVIYRIDRIKALMKTSLEDSDNRVALMISLKAWSLEQM